MPTKAVSILFAGVRGRARCTNAACRGGGVLTTLVILGLIWLGTGAAMAQANAPDPRTETVGDGRKAYLRVGCAQCHGTVGQGGSAGPALAGTPLPYAGFAALLRNPRAEMPPYTAKVLSDGDLAAIYAFVKSLKP